VLNSPTTSYQRRKDKRISAGNGLAALGSSMEASIESLADTIVSSSASAASETETSAIAAIKKSEGLSHAELVDMLSP
jgi:hypothetical protein